MRDVDAAFSIVICIIAVVFLVTDCQKEHDRAWSEIEKAKATQPTPKP